MAIQAPIKTTRFPSRVHEPFARESQTIPNTKLCPLSQDMNEEEKWQWSRARFHTIPNTNRATNSLAVIEPIGRQQQSLPGNVNEISAAPPLSLNLPADEGLRRVEALFEAAANNNRATNPVLAVRAGPSRRVRSVGHLEFAAANEDRATNPAFAVRGRPSRGFSGTERGYATANRNRATNPAFAFRGRPGRRLSSLGHGYPPSNVYDANTAAPLDANTQASLSATLSRDSSFQVSHQI